MTAFTEGLRGIISVGIPQIDDEHQKLFECLDVLMLTVNTPRSDARTAEILNSLQTYSKTHFESEEGLMQACNYPGMAAHKQEHLAFIDKIEKFQEQASCKQANTAQQMTAYLIQWLTAHISNSDKKLARHIRTSSPAKEGG